MSLAAEARTGVIQKFQTHATDTGSPEVQVALLTQRIEHLTSHISGFPNDNSTRRGLFKLVGKRKRLLDYLKDESIERYRKLIAALNLRK